MQAHPLAFALALVATLSHAIDRPTALADIDSDTLARTVKIHRDNWGVAHIHGKTDAAAVFGMAYAQCEDYFWQLEDNCILSVGRYAEVYGEDGLRGDLLNRTFEVPRRSREDYHKLDEHSQESLAAFAAGVNFYLQKHPQVTPRLIETFEPWHVLAMSRHFMLDFTYGRSHVSKPKPLRQPKTAVPALSANGRKPVRLAWNEFHTQLDPLLQQVRDATGSNQWAIAPSRTRDGNAMLFINPHQPWYGWGQFYEAHIRSDEGLNFTGGCFYGSPIPTLGHNERLGWAYTVNKPDMADAWRETFDDADDPLKYRYDNGYRRASEWTDTIRVRGKKGEAESREYLFRKTHHGPIVKRESDTKLLTVQVAGIFDINRPRQAFEMARAENFEQWKAAVSLCAIPMFNIAYADCDGNIFYVYNGSIPVRDPKFDWRKPLDGSDPQTEWKGLHKLEDLPQVLNPQSGYVQNCNSSPCVTTDSDNPFPGDFPDYLLEDIDEDKRRSKMSRQLLRNANDLTFDDLRTLAFDSTLHWPLNELPRFERDFERLKTKDEKLAADVEQYFEHLLNWDCKATLDSTQAPLCMEWYRVLYGERQQEDILPQYRTNRLSRFAALKTAATNLKRMYGSWKVKWGDIQRLQRVVNKPNVKAAAFSFSPLARDLPIGGAAGPLGVAFTVYSAPGIPIIRPKRYAVVGISYASVIEFSDRIKAASLTPFGASADRKSPHYFDQAKLLSEGRFKDAWFYDDEIQQHAERSYSPADAAQ